jgi:hypothetical protein
VSAWLVLLALAAFQAYAQRYVIGPDGMSYLDLSDAVTGSVWSRLVDLYWSPGYPFLIGVARLITGAGPQNEIPVIHAVNFVCFVIMLVGFEYFLTSVVAVASGIRGAALRGRMGVAAAYGLFGVFALTMTPNELTTPDLLSDAAILFALGALLRFREPAGRGMRPAAVLGAALGLGGLAKSFLIPWALVCFATLVVGVGRRGFRQAAIAAGIWALFVAPWSALLSMKAGRPTFGDAGRLTYAWFVNVNDPPSIGGVPPGARTPATEAILPGVGLPGVSQYTDPMWANPSQFNGSVAPRFNVRDQARTLRVFQVFYVETLSPLLLVIFLIVTAPRGSLRAAWRLGWPVYVPSAAGLFAYAMVLVTSRYVMPFVLAVTLLLLATLPLARRLMPWAALIGFAIPLGLEALFPDTTAGLALTTSLVGAVFGAVLVLSSRRAAWVAALVFGLLLTRMIFSPVFPIMVRAGAVTVLLFYWRTALASVRAGRPVWFARRTQEALATALAIALVFRTGLRFHQDVTALARAASPTWGNVQWKIAAELERHGIAPGTRIAVIGSHAEAYWARAARLHIVANVPRLRAAAFWELPTAAQDSLLSVFHAAGATMAIATLGPAGAAPDATWTPVDYRGWIRSLDK